VQDLRGVFDAVRAQLRRLPAGGAAGKELAQLSKRVTALGRLTAGVAHEVKNPLNAMTIHLELLRNKIDSGKPAAEVRTHLDINGHEIKRLDSVEGVLKRAPEDMRLRCARRARRDVAVDPCRGRGWPRHVGGRRRPVDRGGSIRRCCARRSSTWR
jgi:phosphoglycerate-specific signal transduction histidine kinase